MEKDIFLNISPLDGRYYRSNAELIDLLSAYLSERSVIRYEAAVEAALITVMERYGMVAKGSGRQMAEACKSITPEEVYAEEEKTRHNIRALVNVLQRYVDGEIAPFIHLTATSEDITGTAFSLRVRDCFFKVIIPKCVELMDILVQKARDEAETVQIGRTHGQHAVPVTVGYLFAGYADRFGGRVLKIADAVSNLRGKLSGAVGAYNAQSLVFEDPRKFEEDVLSELGLSPGNFSSQIIEPEYILDLVHGVISGFGILAQIGDDLRHLQRTEIGELGERFEKGQVGSSTMPHKRNPWNFEHVKSMWKEFVPRIITRYFDQISEHQRDLTNSASARFIGEIFTGFTLAVDRLLKQLKKLVIDHDNLKRNLELTGGMFLAEPLYILLAAKGREDAHEAVKRATLRAQKEGKSIFDVIGEDTDLKSMKDIEQWQKLSRDPQSYTGRAEERALALSSLWEANCMELKKSCAGYRSVMDGK